MSICIRSCICTMNSLVNLRYISRNHYCVHSIRHFSVQPPKIKPPGKLKGFVVKKYVGHIEKFEVKFETKYPTIYKVYKLFKDGIREFFYDTKMYYRVGTDIWNGKSIATFSRKELFVYRQMPSDMVRSAPVIIAAPLPLVPYGLYPIAYMFPRHLLCRHFWTEQQRIDFAQDDLVKHRLPHVEKVLQYMNNRAAKIRDPGLQRMFDSVINRVENGTQPEVKELLELKELFSTYPFGLQHLARRHKFHAWHLSRSLDLSVGKKLPQDASIFHHMDLAIRREGIESLSFETLQQCCFARGLNAVNMRRQDLTTYLEMWTHLSSEIDSSSISMMLHAPVLLGYSQPRNRKYWKSFKSLSSER